MIPTFIAIVFLLLLFSKRFRESFKSFIKYFPDFYKSLIIKNKDSFFKLSAILILTVLIVDTLIVIVFSIFEIPSTIAGNFLSDFIEAIALLYLFKSTTLILYNQNLYGYFKTDISILKNFFVSMVLIGLVVTIDYVLLPVTSLLPSYEIFEEIHKETFQKPANSIEFILMMLSISILPALVEEIFFRGILYRNFRKKYGIIISVIILTIVFYLFHLDPQMIFFLIIGNIVLCLSFEYTKSLVVPFVIHLGINFCSLLFYLNKQSFI